MNEDCGKIQRFLTVCDELLAGKYFEADKKIKELLQTVAESKQLTDLFSAVTERFDYVSAKSAYLKYPAALGMDYGAAYLPADRSEALAFIFCLLVEVDGGEMRFNEFLLRYFYEDGSYTASYSLFADRMLRPFRDIVKGCFPFIEVKPRDRMKEVAVADAISTERKMLADYRLSAEENAAAQFILDQAVRVCDKPMLVRALLMGYERLLRANQVMRSHVLDEVMEWCE